MNKKPDENKNIEIEEVEKINKSKKKKGFPSAFTVLFGVLILATLLTYVVPAGKFSTIEYDKDKKIFLITDTSENVKEETASEDTLKKYGLSLPLDSFTSGAIEKPVSIPGSYKRVESKPQGIKELIEAPIKGIYASIEIITFVLILSGVIGLVNSTGAFDAGISHLTTALSGKEFLMVTMIFILVATGGTTFGFAEETVAIYPLLIPVFIRMGYDPLLCLGTVFTASTVGTMFSTVNPFSAVIASDAAGISFRTGQGFRAIGLVIASIASLIFLYRYSKKLKKDLGYSIMKGEFSVSEEDKADFKTSKFDLRKKLSLLILMLSFIAMVYVIAVLKLGFLEMTGVFLIAGILIMAISGLGEKQAVSSFIRGASDVVSTALIIGIARGINVIMNDGRISDTLLSSASNLVSGMNGTVFIVILFILFAFLGIFIPSSSGLSVLSMPIIAPLTDSVGMGRDIAVSALCYGQTWMSFIAPTALILIACELTSVPYNKWIKFILPLMGIISVISVIMLVMQNMFL